MELFELVLLLLGAVLVSTVLDQMVPRVSLPLVQIGLGAAIMALSGAPIQVEVDPELFLVLFIAPLLFDEARHAEKRALWDNKGAIVSLAVGLVLATVLATGFVLHWIEPSVSLAAAFALGAALGPTDAVAVTALGKDVRLSQRQHALLSGEALINDASGVVSFQFAIAAAVTGAFSLADAAASFAVSFFGGIAFGLALGLVAALALRLIRSQGFESVTVHVVFEVFTPFIVFLLAEHADVSGILAVVAAGLLMALLPKELTPASARLKIASDSVWETLVFVVNGVVFVLLGMQLPQAIMPTWNGPSDAGLLVGLVLLLIVMVVGVRFAWVFVMERLAQRGVSGRAVARGALVTTLAGPKGAVTLSIMFTIPMSLASGEVFPNRDLLIFLASGVILCTLLLANFAVPLLAPRGKDAESSAGEGAASIRVLEGVLRQLREREVAGSEAAARLVARQYEERIKRLQLQDAPAARLVELRAESLACQRAYVQGCVDEGSVTHAEGRRYLDQIDRSAKVLRRGVHRGGADGAVGRFKVSVARLAHSFGRVIRRLRGAKQANEGSLEFRIGFERCALEFFETQATSADAETASAAAALAAECRAALEVLGLREDAGEADVPAVTAAAAGRAKTEVAEVEAEALRLELDEIQRLREEGVLDREAARKLREEVYLLQMTTSG